MPRTAARFATTLVTSLMLLAMSAIPALAASAGTKPDPVKDEFLVGSLPELGLAAAVGVGIGILAFILLGKGPELEDEGH